MTQARALHAARVLAFIAVALAVVPAFAQATSERPLRIIVPFSAAGPTDVLARIIAPMLSTELKRPVIVENKVGATGAIGSVFVAQSPPDGDTLLLATSSSMAASPSLKIRMPFDPVNDFAPITMIATIENVLVVNPDVPATNVRELVAYAKKNPGKLTYASSGIGSTYHLAGELFAAQTGIQLTHVPYKGAAPAIQDVLAGHVDLMFDNMSSAIPNIRQGRTRALGVASLKRYPSLPELPTIDEQGVKGYQATIWLAMFAPARTPPATIAALAKSLHAVVDSPEYVEKLKALDLQPASSTSTELADYLKGELTKWQSVIKAAGITLD